MLRLFSGTDRQRAREALDTALKKGEDARIVRITDAHALADLRAALYGGGMFGEERAVVFDGVLANEEMRDVLVSALPILAKAKESFFVLESALDATTRKVIEKHAEKSEQFDAKKSPEEKTIFALANALRKSDKKALWVSYMRELEKGSAPEAVHGILFWGAKDMFLKSSGIVREHAGKLVSDLAELPHTARRQGFDLEYALERYILDINKS